MNNNNKLLLIFVSLTLLLVPFQNCSSPLNSNIQFESTSTNSTTSTDSGLPTTTPVASQPVVVNPVTPVVSQPITVPSSGKMNIFIASGKVGRTLMSCDDGQTWINDRSDNNNARCWVTGDPNYVECDHDPGSAVGLDVSDDGTIYAQYGWGYNGSVRKSIDGKNWSVVRTGGWGGGVAVFNSTVFSYWGGNDLSKDKGLTWQASTAPSVYDFDHAFASRAGNIFFLKGRKDGDFAYSLDAGVTWKKVSYFLNYWGESFAVGNGIIVATGTKDKDTANPTGYAARSTDNGQTWTAIQVHTTKWNSNVVFNGKEFMNWTGGKVWKSVDGVNWTSTAFVIDKDNSMYWSGPVSFNPVTGAYASIKGNWGSWYNTQIAIRSTDGINWTVLDNTKFKGGHPISYMKTATVNKSVCGL